MDCLLPSSTQAISMDLSLKDTNFRNLNFPVNDFATTAVVQYLLASKWESPNVFRACLPVITQLNIPAWEFFLQNYHDAHVVEFLRFGWPVSYTSKIPPTSSSSNHPSAVAFSNDVEHYIHTELSYHAIAGPFSTNSLHQPLVCSPLQTVPIQHRIVMDLSFPHSIRLMAEFQPQVTSMSPTSLDSQVLIVYVSLFFNMVKVAYSIKRIYDERTDKSLLVRLFVQQ